MKPQTQLFMQSSGLFSAVIPAPSGSGEYTVVAVDIESGIRSPWLNFSVLGINDPKTIKIVLTENEVITVPLSGSSRHYRAACFRKNRRKYYL